MERAKCEVTGPLFPRLHVNDREKGVPTLHPRNKIALYEQASGPLSMLPHSHSNCGSLVPPTSSSHGGRSEMGVLSSFGNSPVLSHLSGKLHSYSIKGFECDAAVRNLERRSMESTKFQSFNAKLHLSSTHNSHQPYNISNSEKSEVSVIVESASHFRKSRLDNSREKHTHSNATVELHVQKQLKETIIEKGQVVSPVSQESSTVPVVGGRTFAGASSSQSVGDKYSKPVKQCLSLLNQQKSISSADDSKKLHDIDAGSHLEYVSMEKSSPLRENVVNVKLAEVIRKGNALGGGGETFLRLSRESNDVCPKGLENFTAGIGDKSSGSFYVGDDRKYNISDTSMLYSQSGLEITTDNILGLMGEENFWKARAVITNQQRIFALQVFELHRLTKVQRSIAGSPQLVFEGNLSLLKPLPEVPPLKKIPPDFSIEPPKNESQEPNFITECTSSKPAGKPPSDSRDKLVMKQPTLMTTETRQDPRSFHPSPQNQWLVPIMSPSEGLVYKPYTGPAPPTPGLIPTASCGPASATLSSKGSLNKGIGIPSSSPLGPTCFLPCGIQNMSHSTLGSSIEQAQDCQVLREDLNSTVFHPLKEHKAAASTESSPSKVAQRQELALFPTEPTLTVVKGSTQARSCKQQAQIIKVVPRNRRLATESAIRIFQSIQEERNQQD